MVVDPSIAPLSSLTIESRNLLSSLLNIKKVIPHVGPDRLTRHRDWRGLASLINISSELAANINECNDKTAKVLDHWINKNDNTDTVGYLLQYLQWIDRFDVHDDILELHKLDKLIAKSHINCIPRIVGEDTDENVITFDDKMYGTPQEYHAYVLYAQEDREFVEELVTRLTEKGFLMCTEENLLPGLASKFEPVARLMAERCRYIILIYSPDFLRSPAINFCTNLAQADGITKKQHKIIPVMYRECTLPDHLKFYYNLRYNRPGDKAPFDFWKKLIQTLGGPSESSRLNGSCLPYTQSNIKELSSIISNGFTPVKEYTSSVLSLPSIPSDTRSLNELNASEDPVHESMRRSPTHSLSQSERVRKKSRFNKFFKMFKGKKYKASIVVDN